jgi:hypothetical protein
MRNMGGASQLGAREKFGGCMSNMGARE